MIAVNGCRPTAVAMVAAGLTGDNTITPYRVAQFAAENGYYAGDAGTSWAPLPQTERVSSGSVGEEMGLRRVKSFQNWKPDIRSSAVWDRVILRQRDILLY